MTDQAAVDWPTCDRPGCIGIRLPRGSMCLAHATARQRNAAFKRLGETGEIDVRGVPINQALLEQILAAAPQNTDNHATFTTARFDAATFQSDAWFSEATFQGGVRFGRATFQSDAWFNGVTFHRITTFDRVTFQRDVEFSGATFHSYISFGGATFQRGAGFGGATFQSYAQFGGATFRRYAGFGSATFQGDVSFDGATFQRDARFTEATFEGARLIGPLVAYRSLELDDAQFAQPVQIEASTLAVCCHRARFAGGVQFRLRWAGVLLDDADFAAPSILAGIPRLTGGERLAARERRIAKVWQRLLGGAVSEQPRLLSLRRANVAGLALASIELADCRFAGAHNLDQLRLEADVSFGTAPVWLRWDWRQVIAEERAWRADRSGRWTKPLWPAWADQEPAVLEAGQIAGLYRALRKGREDAKDELWSTVFYYGEICGKPSVGRTEVLASVLSAQAGGLTPA